MTQAHRRFFALAALVALAGEKRALAALAGFSTNWPKFPIFFM